MRGTLRLKLQRDLWGLRTQTATIAILIISGVSLLVATWSAYGSLRNARDSYYNIYRFADVFADFKRAPIDTLRKIETISGVESLQRRIVGDGLVVLPSNSEPALGRFLSLPSGEQPNINRIHLRKGRLPENSAEAEVLVHEGFAIANHLDLGDILYLQVQGRRERARIVGIGISPEFVYALSPYAPLPDDLHFGVFWLTEKVLQRLMSIEDGFNNIAVRLDPMASREAIISNIDQILSRYGSLGAYDRERQISNMFLQDEISQQRSSAIFIPAIFLGIATFLVNIVASRLIALHRLQIATMKALGYSRWEVSRHYLQLMILITFFGAAPGICIGAFLGRWMSKIYESYFRFPELHFSINTGAALIGLLAGIFPGLMGAWAGIRSIFLMAPAEAMRPPAPPYFHATVLEKWGVLRNLSTRAKMVLRNLFFHPGRLVLIVASLCAAVAVLITAGAWADIVDFMLENQFNRLQREDLGISLVRPRPVSAMQEVLGIPGVIAVEGYRVVPIRIRFRNQKREISLVGWPQTAIMQKKLDASLQPISLPEHGLLLSKFFHSSWNLRVGDEVEIEPLEGHYGTISVPVAGFSNDLIGLNASMRIENLWRLMGEGPVYNQIAVQADPRKLAELYARLRLYPEVSGIALKAALYRGFRSSFGNVIRSTTNILMVASLLIALGIIYNSVRVSFSERAWELASLRVLGFARRQVTAVLLMEVGAQAAWSLIPGCLLGLALTHLSMRLVHTETFSFPVVIERATYAKGILTVVMAFIASSWIVHKMVNRMHPAEALKSRE